MTAAAPVYPYDEPGDFHDTLRCRCDRHCRNCGYRLEGRQRLYCSEYCGQRYRAEVRLDDALRSALSAP